MISGQPARRRITAAGLPDGLPVALAGIAVGVLAGAVLARAGELTSVVILGTIAVVGLTPIVASLGRLALPTWVTLSGVLYPFLRYPADNPAVTFDRLYLCALLIFFALEYRRRRQAEARESTWLQRGFIVLTAIFLLSALTTGGQGNLAAWLDAFLLPAIAFWCTRQTAREPNQALRIAGAMALGGAGIALLGLGQKFAGIDLAPLVGSTNRFDAAIGQVRISGPFSAPEPFALVLLSCLAGTMVWIRARGSAAFVAGGAALALELSAIFFTYFRAAWLGAVLILLVAVVGSRRSWGGRVLAVAVALAAVALASSIASDNEAVRTRLHDQQNISGRLATYERGLELFKRHPVAGVGFQEFPKAVHELPRTAVAGVEELEQAHSSLISTLAEQGLIGFIPLLATAAALVLALRALWVRGRSRLDRQLAIYAIGGALAYLVMSATLTMIYYGPSNAMFAVLLGLVCGRLDAITASSSRA